MDNQETISSKEAYEQKKEAKEMAKKSTNKGRSSKRAIRWLVFIVGLGFLVWGMVKIGGGNKIGGGVSPSVMPTEVLASEWTKGPADAPLTLIEYADFQCPACATFYPLVKQLQGEFGDKLRIVFRHLPLRTIHKNADEAAYAAEAAGKQGKFWEMHDLIYEHQQEWANLGNPEDKFVGYASSLGLDKKKFEADYDSDEIEKKIDEAYNAATKAGLSSTPTFILNGRRVQPRSYEEFQAILNNELAK